MSGGLRVARSAAAPRATESEPRLRRCTTADGHPAPCPAGAAPHGVGPAALLALQRRVGNQAVTRWLRPEVPTVTAPVAAAAVPAAYLAQPAVQRQLEDDVYGKHIRRLDLKNNPPAWFGKLGRSDREALLLKEKQLVRNGRSQLLSVIAELLAIDLPDAPAEVEDPEDASFTMTTPKRASKYGGQFHSVYPTTMPMSPGGTHHEIACSEPGCNTMVKMDPGTYHEVGVGKKPPICHPLDLPAAHTGHALDSLVQTHHPNPAFFMLSAKYTAAKKTVQWDLPTLTAGHTACNLSHKDTPWNYLSTKKQKKVMDEVINHLISQGMLQKSGKGYAFI